MRVTSVVLRTAVSAVVGLGLGLGLLTAPANAAAPAGLPVLSPRLTAQPSRATRSSPGRRSPQRRSTACRCRPRPRSPDRLAGRHGQRQRHPGDRSAHRAAVLAGRRHRRRHGHRHVVGRRVLHQGRLFRAEPFGGADVHVYHYPSQTPVLQWAAMAGVKSYKVEIDDEYGFISSPSYTTPNTSLAVTAAVILNKPYYWRVSGVMPSGAPTAKSSTGTFMVDWPAHGQPELLSPASGVIDAISDVVLRWAPVEGAKNYQVQVNANPDFTNGSTDDQIVLGTQYSPGGRPT